MSTASIGSRLEAELGTIAERCGCELLAAHFAGSVLRLILDREDQPGGVTLKDCECVSREASALLDVEDFASGRYVLEVSSPGLDREFYRDSDYPRFDGQRVKVTWRDPGTGAKRTDVGTLDATPTASARRIDLATEQSTLDIGLDDIVSTRLEPRRNGDLAHQGRRGGHPGGRSGGRRRDPRRAGQH